jgi:hypothetical protein
MNVKILIVAALMLLSSSAQARTTSAEESKTLQQRADEHAESITESEKFIDEIDDALDMARDGGYGRLKRGMMAKLDAARDNIARLLEGHANALELGPEERIALYNDQELITATLNNDQKDRVICKREVRVGSRLPTTECMTVAEREARAKLARENTEGTQRNVCVPGVGNDCVK